MDSSTVAVPAPDSAVEPAGFVVTVGPGDRIHFLDWGGGPATIERPGVLLIHGLSQTAWSWAPVARRLCVAMKTIAMDLRGHGLSDAPTGDDDYAPAVLAEDAVAAAEGSGALPDGGRTALGTDQPAIAVAFRRARCVDRRTVRERLDGRDCRRSANVDIVRPFRAGDEGHQHLCCSTR